jgi:hypothetical protein
MIVRTKAEGLTTPPIPASDVGDAMDAYRRALDERRRREGM